MRLACACLGLALALSASARADDLATAAASLGRELGHAMAKAAEKPSGFSAPAFSETGPGVAGLGATAAEAAAKAFAAETKLARANGAQALLTGSIAATSDKLVLQARVVWVATGKVLASAKAEATPARPLKVAGAVESQSIEVAIRKLSDSLAASFSKLPGESRYRRLAVLPFTDVGEEAQKRQVGTIVAAEVATGLKRDHNLLLVERQKLVEVMGELRIQQSGAVDPSHAAEIGKLADAQALVIGTASHLGDRYLVDARVVSTESGETLGADSASVAAAGMVALASDAVVLRSRKDAFFRSLLIPGWGQIYNRQPLKGFLIMGAEAALIGGAVAFHLSGEKAYSDYTSKTNAGDLGTDPASEAAQLYDTAESRYKTRNILLFCAAGLWVANLVDAYLSGVDGDEMLAGGVAWKPVVTTDGKAVYAALRF